MALQLIIYCLAPLFWGRIAMTLLGTSDDILKSLERGEWKPALAELIAHLIRTKCCSDFEVPPQCDPKHLALFAATLNYYSKRLNIYCPAWAARAVPVKDEPWFPAGLVSMRAAAVLESPIEFRRNNVFVTKEFFQRV